MPDYKWERFWCPREANSNLSSDGGFLYDPDSEIRGILNPGFVTLESLAKKKCLVLLGEPGIGKTYTVEKYWRSFEKSIDEKKFQTLYVNLNEYGSEYRLVRELFENKVFTSWVNSSHNLYLFLDSLDECLLEIKNLGALLVNRLKRYPVDRLYLRTICRTADWKNSIEDGLKDIWGKEVVEIYQLAPLRKIDVTEALKINDLEVDHFLDEIKRKKAEPLAIKPITLEFLIKTYSRNKCFPDTQEELYFRGCQLLCEETNISRRDAGHRGKFTAEQKMAVASRIAAISVYANRYAIWTNVDMGDVPDEDFNIKEICGGKEKINGNTFEVDESVVEEALGTGLFTSRGPHRMGWAHQTFAEYLAAYYLKEHNLTLNQMMGLIIHPGDPNGKIVPSLQETAAWLAGMVPEVFTQIIKSDPIVLLRSDVSKSDYKARSDLVGSLLRQYDEKKLMDNYPGNNEYYKKILHPGLAEQLLVYIKDNNKSPDARSVAIDIATVCRLQSLLDDLIEIALDSQQQERIREDAAYAILRIADNKANPMLEKLKPLVLGEAADDPNDELKGCALQALWPSLLNVEELFQALTPEKKSDFIGAYSVFILDTLLNHTWGDDIKHALKWVSTQNKEKLEYTILRNLADSIIKQAWENLELPGVLEAFAKALLNRLNIHGKAIELGSYNRPETCEDSWMDNDEKRRQVLKVIFNLLTTDKTSTLSVLHSDPQLVFKKDFQWMLKCLQENISTEEKKVWAEFIRIIFDVNNVDQLNAIISISREEPILYEEFAYLLKPVPLESLETEKKKQRYYKIKEMQNIGNRGSNKASALEEIVKLLDKFDSGDLSAWGKLNNAIKKGGNNYGILEPDLTKLPGWQISDDILKSRIIKAAQKYIMETAAISSGDVYAYSALLLIFQKLPEFFVSLPENIWERYLPLIISFPCGTLYKEIHNDMIKYSYKLVPNKFKEALLTLIGSINQNQAHIFIISNLEKCWDEELVNLLESKIKFSDLGPNSMEVLLKPLMIFKSIVARKYVESLLSMPIPSEGHERKRVTTATKMLVLYTNDAGWSIVWPAIQNDVDWGKEIISSIAPNNSKRKLIEECLTEEQLSEFYIWMQKYFPYADDPEIEGSIITPRFDVGRWRHSILNSLKDRGTHQACEGIRRIMHEFPGLDWLERYLYEAQNINRKQTWIPYSIKTILEITKNRDRRLVQNEQQFIEVLLESLGRLESKLHAETPASRDLWDYNNKKGRPIPENDFSNYIKRHFDDELVRKGIIVNREVQIHRGERTDIHIDAVTIDDEDVLKRLTVIIEVKGCWHKDLNTAMKDQLVGRYLSDNNCKSGIYLIGWFNCESWDKDDYRYKNTPKINKDEAREKFNKQATDLSQDGYCIKAVVLDTSD